MQSRYYDPELGRFVNSDTFITTGQGFLGNNSFAYCLNNPVCYVDYYGNFAISATLAATNWWNPVGWASAALLVVESIVFTVGLLALTYDLLFPTHRINISSGNSSDRVDQSTQISDSQSAASGSPTPPNNKNNNNDKNNKKLSLKKISKQLLKRSGLNAHAIKREYLGQKAEIAKFDLAYDTISGAVFIITKDGTMVEQTWYTIWDNIPTW